MAVAGFLEQRDAPRDDRFVGGWSSQSPSGPDNIPARLAISRRHQAMNLFTLLPLMSLCFGIAAPTHVENPPSRRKIVVVAHRGANKFAPENTLAALLKAIPLGCHYVEM